MYEITIAIMSVFAVLGVMSILQELCSRMLSKTPCGKILIYVESEADRLEGMVRTLIFKNPTAELVIKNTGGDSREVAKRLQRENPRIHFQD